ncbi:hypothetical protein A33K_17599 [Burkholderia humptydooensis MSMB43]|uniref:Uncharacterized protein n=1 Tax=Burkholderia humptydooensis MSMB43 TaxID=441157 RepID=A0ABN0FZX2_9BURK|nr:hypothetical protein A33K_17599 [Burkholderia humptydooensis MSMB43]
MDRHGRPPVTWTAARPDGADRRDARPRVHRALSSWAATRVGAVHGRRRPRMPAPGIALRSLDARHDKPSIGRARHPPLRWINRHRLAYFVRARSRRAHWKQNRENGAGIPAAGRDRFQNEARQGRGALRRAAFPQREFPHPTGMQNDRFKLNNLDEEYSLCHCNCYRNRPLL